VVHHKLKWTGAYLSFSLQMPAHDFPVKSNLSIHELNIRYLFCSKCRYQTAAEELGWEIKLQTF
jgi:hypothetical protein